MRYLVTGATGFVGANLVRRLLDDGHAVHAIVRRESGNWRTDSLADKIALHRADLADAEATRRAVEQANPEAVIHLANAGLYGGMSAPDDEYVRVNILGLVNLAAACGGRSLGAFVNVGSSSEYGVKSAPMDEADRCEPQNVYGVTKLAATCYASLLARTGALPAVTLRLFSPFGPYDEPKRLVTSVALHLLRGSQPTLANPDAVRDYVHVDDVVEALLAAVPRAAAHAGEVYNVGSGQQATARTVVEAIARAVGVPAPSEWGAAAPRPWESPVWQAAILKAGRDLGWQPRVTLEQGIGGAVAWFREHLADYADKL